MNLSFPRRNEKNILFCYIVYFIEYDYQTLENNGSLTINIKIFNNEKSVIEKHLILPNRIENKVEIQLFSIKEGFRNLEQVITEFDNGLITTITHKDPYPLEFKEYCAQNPNERFMYEFFQEGLFSSNQTREDFAGSQITESWIDIKTGFTIIKREYNREGRVVYNQILRKIR